MTSVARALKWSSLLVISVTWNVHAQSPVIPHAQDKPPNDPRPADVAAKMMTVPPGFVVDVIASEPNIVNPVAMAIDEKGRFWITESLEYPRRDPGPGKDRVKLLEDTDGDGKADKFSVFLDGLNIPSGVQVGHGGVWIANAPDILFVPDADRDGKPDGPAQVVVTGFGRTDTHELPNSLTWGPDGWLYGLNGVYNISHVKYHKDNPNYDKVGGDKHPGWPITCALFRIHPRTREFQVFCEGTSNPWGIAFNEEGDAFVSACVIDHLWHLVETGYYHRQGGPYPPHTWKIESIVKHKHQKAAYCGITWFDSDAYPEQYRKKLYMGNIHGGCINVDRIERNGSTYAGFGEPDFLTANDSWFMPVVQKTGPDGCLYILDWYDRYHCYQDANRDPNGIDRLKGRLYRVRYTGETTAQSPTRAGGANPLNPPTTRSLDLGALPDDQLIALLGNPNIWRRETARRILQERSTESSIRTLEELVVDSSRALETRLEAYWARCGCATVHDKFLKQVWDLSDVPLLQAWALRTSRTIRGSSNTIMTRDLLNEPRENLDPRIRLEWVLSSAAGMKPSPISSIDADQRFIAVTRVLDSAGDDPLLPRIVWQNMISMIRANPASAWQLFGSRARFDTPEPLLARILRMMNDVDGDAGPGVAMLTQAYLAPDAKPEKTRQFVAALQEISAEGLIPQARWQKLRAVVESNRRYVDKTHDAETMRALKSVLLQWGAAVDLSEFRELAQDSKASPSERMKALRTLVKAGDSRVLSIARQVLTNSEAAWEFRAEVLGLLAQVSDPQVAPALLKEYSALPSELQPKVIELLTERPAWSRELLTAIGDKRLPASVLSVNHARKLSESKDAQLRELLSQHWGQVREGRSSDRDQIIANMRALIRKQPGDAVAGAAAFKKVCAQCHKIYGEGAEVGPDITLNGRNDYTQLLSNVFDPSLVIGAGYRSYTVVTEDGRVINGLLAEDSPQRVVLKVQGGKQEVIPRDNIEALKVSEISLMPEQLERQLTPQEIVDLFAFITLDKPPGDPTAKRLPGVYDVAPRESEDPAQFAAIFQEVAAGFTQVTSGEGGVGLLKEHMGRPGVVRTHPLTREKPATMSGTFKIPEGKTTKLVVDVSHDPRGDWRLVVTAGPMGGRLIDELITKETCKNGWATFTADLTKFAGQEIPIRLTNQANDWAWEFAYWGSVRILSE